MTPEDFVKLKYPVFKNNLDMGYLDNMSGSELVELIKEYLDHEKR